MSQADRRDPKPAPSKRAPEPVARKTRGYIETVALSSIGIEMGLCVVFGLLIGRWLDGRFGTAPLGMLVFLLIGIAAAGKAVHRALQKMDRIAERNEREGGDA